MYVWRGTSCTIHTLHTHDVCACDGGGSVRGSEKQIGNAEEKASATTQKAKENIIRKGKGKIKKDGENLKSCI